MKIGTLPENFIERLALMGGIPPPGLIESWLGLMLTRSVMAAVKLDIFEALASGPATSQEVAARCGTHPQATRQLLNALVGVGTVRVCQNRYRIGRSARAWLLKDGKYSFRDQILLRYLEWHWWEHCEEYVRTGRPLRVHETLSEQDWGVYERGMRAGIELPARWVARHLPVPDGATDMLDIGGGHGLFSVAVCRRYPQLRATVLELPQAIEHVAPILARENMGDRVVHRAGDALADDLGTGRYDVVFLSAMVHISATLRIGSCCGASPEACAWAGSSGSGSRSGRTLPAPSGRWAVSWICSSDSSAKRGRGRRRKSPNGFGRRACKRIKRAGPG